MALNVKKGSDAVRGSAMRVCAPPHGVQGKRPRPTLAARPRLEGALALGLAESTRSSAHARQHATRAPLSSARAANTCGCRCKRLRWRRP
eukprot:6472969-Prymnesium_polylepis.2